MSYLIADIGATHARFSILRKLDENLDVQPGVVLATGDYQRADLLLDDALDRLGAAGVSAAGMLAGACFAVAGPVDNGLVQITNGGLEFSESKLARLLGCPLRLVNDFHALAMAIPRLQRLDCLGGDDQIANERRVKAVLGPGSGLGMSVLLPERTSGWRVLTSEGGHADLAPGNLLEQELLTLLQASHGSVSWEMVLSGPGLVHLYQAVAALWGTPAREIGAEEISAQGVDADDPICHQTLEIFFALLGAAAGNLALTVCARGGVYIGGGIVPELRDFARTSPLRRRFEERAGLQKLVGDIPLYLILDESPGLIGAGVCLTHSDLS